MNLDQYISRKTRTDLLILCIPAIILTAVWFQGGMIIAGHEPGLFWYDSARWFNISTHAWTDFYGLGSAHTRGLAGLTFHAGGTALDFITGSPLFKEIIYFSSTLVFDSIFMYLFARRLFKDGHGRQIALLAGMFYTLNAFMLYSWNRNALMPFALPALPLFLYLYLRGIESNKHLLMNVFMLCAAVTAFVFTITIIPILVPLVIVIFSISYLVFNRSKVAIKNFVRFNLVLIPCLIFTFGWFIFPLYISTAINQSSGENVSTLQTNPHIAELQQNNAEFRFVSHHFSSMLDSLRLIGLSHSLISLYPFYASGALDVPPAYIENPADPASTLKGGIPTLGPLGAIGFLLPVLAFSAIFVKKYRKITLPFAIIAIIGVILSNGTNPPFENVTLWLFSNVPFFVTLRTMFEKIGSIIALSYSILIPVSLVTLYHYRKETTQKIFSFSITRMISLTLIFLLLGPYVYPLWTGSVFQHPWIKESPFYVKVPDYYFDAGDWLNSQEDTFSVMILPLVPGDGATYNWEYGYSGISPYSTLFNKPVFAGYGNSNYDLRTFQLLSKYAENYQHSIAGLSSALNIKYLIMDKDIATDHITFTPHPPSFDFIRDSITKRIRIFDVDKITTLSFQNEDSSKNTVRQLNFSGRADPTGMLEKEFTTSNDSKSGTSIIEGQDVLMFNWTSNAPVSLQLKLTYITGSKEASKIIYNSSGTVQDNVIINLFENLGFDINKDLSIKSLTISAYGGEVGEDITIETSNVLLGQMEYYGSIINPSNVINQEVWLDRDMPYSLGLVPMQLIDGVPITQFEGNPTKAIEEIHLDEGLFGFIARDMPKNFNYTHGAFLHFWVWVEAVSPLYIDVYDAHGEHCSFDGRDDSRFAIEEQTWSQFLIPVECATNTKFDPFAIDGLLIGTLNLDQDDHQTIRFGGLKIVNPNQETANLIKPVRQFGNLEIFELTQYEDNRVYSTTRPIIFESDQNLQNYIINDQFNVGNQVLFISPSESDYAGRIQIALTENQELMLRSLDPSTLTSPSISFTKVSPAEYSIHVENSRGKFFLVLNDMYEPLWRAYIVGQSGDDDGSVVAHFPANISSNAWLIDKKGSFDIQIIYEPERMLHTAGMISIISFIALFAGVVVERRFGLQKNRALIKLMKREL